MTASSGNFYWSRAWRRKREQILRRDKYLCQISLRYGKYVEATTVHHIYPLEDYPQYALCGWNLISVGEAVNNKLHDRKTGELTKMGRDLMRRTPVPQGE